MLDEGIIGDKLLSQRLQQRLAMILIIESDYRLGINLCLSGQSNYLFPHNYN
jgi:hypothetical protein